MTKILTTLDGSRESEAVLPVVEALARGLDAHVSLMIVLEPANAMARTAVSTTVQETEVTVPGATAPIVMERPDDPRWAEDEEQALRRVLNEGRDYLAPFAHALREAGVEVESEAVIGTDAAKEIIEQARRQETDLIAMSTHGRGALREVVQGSVAAEVVRSGIAPVILVRPKAQS